MKMTTEEAFVKVLQMHGIEHAFGIIGSAFMPISDLFPAAGITFWDVAHEGNAGMMADGYSRVSGKMSMCIAQNGPGITNFVTAVKTAYWNHTPLLLVTPQAANKTIGQGGFQEVEQMALFKDMVGYQEEVRDASRVAEVLNRVIMNAPETRCEIISRTITTGGVNIARGHIAGHAVPCRGHLECKGLILGGGQSLAIPELDATVEGVELSHEAAVGKIAQDEIEYLMARGMDEAEATSTIVRGFLNVEIMGLPEELRQSIDATIAELDASDAM